MYAPKLASVIALAVLTTAGCGDEVSTPTEPTKDLRLPPLSSEPATVQVVSAGGTVADAGIVIQTKAGQLIELRTSPEGTVSLDVDVDDIKSVLAHKDGYTFTAVSGPRIASMLAGSGGIQLYLQDTSPTPLTWVAGTALGMEANDWLTVTADQPLSTASAGQGTTYALQVEKNEPFVLIGLEWSPSFWQPDQGFVQTFHRWTGYASDGVDEPTLLDLDFDYALATETRSGSFHLPEAGVMSDQGRAYVVVTTMRSQGKLFLGAATRIDVGHYEVPGFLDNGMVKPIIDKRDPGDRPVDPWTALALAADEAGVTPYEALAPDAIAISRRPVIPGLIDDDMTAPFEPQSKWSKMRDTMLLKYEPGVRAEYEVEYAVMPPAYAKKLPGVITNYGVTDHGNFAYALERGLPVAGDSDVTIPSMPAVSVDPAPSIHEAVYWRRTGDTLPLVAVAVFDQRGHVVGNMLALEDEGEASCPPLPSTSDPDPVFSGELTAVMVSCSSSSNALGWCARGTQSAPFAVVP